MITTPEQRKQMIAQSKLNLSAYMAEILTVYGIAYKSEDRTSPTSYHKAINSYFIMQRLISSYTAGQYADMEDEMYKMEDYLTKHGNGVAYPHFYEFKKVFNDKFNSILAQVQMLSHVGASVYGGEYPMKAVSK